MWGKIGWGTNILCATSRSHFSQMFVCQVVGGEVSKTYLKLMVQAFFQGNLGPGDQCWYVHHAVRKSCDQFLLSPTIKSFYMSLKSLSQTLFKSINHHISNCLPTIDPPWYALSEARVSWPLTKAPGRGSGRVMQKRQRSQTLGIIGPIRAWARWQPKIPVDSLPWNMTGL